VTTILVVDDEPSLVRGLSYALRREGFEVAVATDGLAAVDAGLSPDVDLVLLDMTLPSLDGIDVCRRIRAQRSVPVIALTARDSERDLVAGLDAGADDYLTKPFSALELVARIRAQLRRRELDRLDNETRREVAGLTIDLAADRVEIEGRPVLLTPSEFKILRLLSSEPGTVFSRRRITEHLWESEHVGDEHTCQVHISSLRKKIEDDPASPARLVTVRGQGYMLAPGG
jgi:two-component system, OmpR family, response regulator RegX3